MTAFEVTGLLIGAGYVAVATRSLWALIEYPKLPYSLRVILAATVIVSVPWAFFYLLEAVGVVDFTPLWRSLARAFHFVTVAAFSIQQVMVLSYVRD